GGSESRAHIMSSVFGPNQSPAKRIPLDTGYSSEVTSDQTSIHSFKRTLRGPQGAAMRHTETMQHEAQPGAGHFFWAATGWNPLTLPSHQAIASGPLILPSFPRGEGEGAA